MNVAYHLKKLGMNPGLITRVGADAEGGALREMLTSYGLNTDQLQVDAVHPTGKVFAAPGADGEMHYDIVPDSAWDYIGHDEKIRAIVADADYFIFGSLSCRNAVSRSTLFQLLESAKGRVLDINLRQPYYSGELVRQLLGHCDIVKMNLPELEWITRQFCGNRTINHPGRNEVFGQIDALQTEFTLPHILVTMGAQGAVLKVAGETYTHPGHAAIVADTVGAGDAFLAGFMKAWADGEAFPVMLERACVLGAFVASAVGACPDYTYIDGIPSFNHHSILSHK